MISLRQALSWSKGLPAGPPAPGPTIVVSGLETVIETMEPGDLSDIIESEHGYHVITLVEKKPGSTVELEEVRDAIRKEIEQRKSDSAIAEYCAERAGDEDIDTFLQLEKTIATHPQRDEIIKRLGRKEE